jgi:hypothetical protein
MRGCTVLWTIGVAALAREQSVPPGNQTAAAGGVGSGTLLILQCAITQAHRISRSLLRGRGEMELADAARIASLCDVELIERTPRPIGASCWHYEMLRDVAGKYSDWSKTLSDCFLRSPFHGHFGCDPTMAGVDCLRPAGRVLSKMAAKRTCPGAKCHGVSGQQ